MSRYQDYDHAGWVQRQLEASRRYKPTKVDRDRAAEQCGWWGAPEQLNDFHKRAFTLLGVVGGGIYNCPISWKTLHWSPDQIIVPWRAGLSTWDFNGLTVFTFLCHMARMRGGIGIGRGRGYLEIFLSQRQEAGSMSVRHPSLDQALHDFLGWYQTDQPLTYPGTPAPALTRIHEAVTAYHHALDTRQHGDVAAHRFVETVQSILGMSWVQGATLKPEAESTAAT